MAKAEKTYKIKQTRAGRSGNDTEKIIEGTLTYLIQYFSYTLEIGNSNN